MSLRAARAKARADAQDVRLDDLARDLAATSTAARTEHPLHHHTVLRVGGPAAIWARVETVEQLRAATRLARKHGVHWQVLWAFEDIIVRDGGIRGLVLRPGQGWAFLDPLPPTDTLQPGVRIGAACTWAALRGLPGIDAHPDLARVSSWPGSVGATLASKDCALLAGVAAGMRLLKGRTETTITIGPGEPPPRLARTHVLHSLELRTGHRKRGKAELFSAGPAAPGTLFTDPPGDSAAELLERAGVDRSRLRAWQLRAETPGAVINLGGGTATDLTLFVQGLRTRVERHQGPKLLARQAVIGNDVARRP